MKRYPLESTDIPTDRLVWIRCHSGSKYLVTEIHSKALVSGGYLNYNELMKGFEISVDGCKTWSPCWKESKP
jgi:hypothetical protein